MYYESIRSMAALPPSTREVPLGFASFPAEIFFARRRWAEADNNIVRWTEFEQGGHFAALEQPDLLVTDIREFFSPLR
jgi:microsomal epoxide hydrolase